MAYTISRAAVEGALYEADFDPADYDSIIRPAYSGRGMYGETCFGIVGSDHDLLRFAISLTTEDNQAHFWLPEVRSDQMGLNRIYYWPSVTLVD